MQKLGPTDCRSCQLGQRNPCPTCQARWDAQDRLWRARMMNQQMKPVSVRKPERKEWER